MAEALVLFGLGLVLLALGGDSIVKGASGLAQKFGASPFIAGLLLIAFGTSIPELFVNALGRRADEGQYLEGVKQHVAKEIYNIGDSFQAGLVWGSTKAAYNLAQYIRSDNCIII